MSKYNGLGAREELGFRETREVVVGFKKGSSVRGFPALNAGIDEALMVHKPP